MDIFKFGSATDLSTQVGALIKAGTDPLLMGPDWSRNLDICDLVSSSKEVPEQAVRAILRRLQDNDQNTVYLAMVIAETCMKNCASFVVCAHQKPFLDEFANIARGNKGSKNGTEALRLIQLWGRTYEKNKRETFPLFFESFINMKSKGFLFPKEEESVLMDPSSGKR